MKYDVTIRHPEDSLGFMRALTFIGGFLNAYSFFTRGGVFVTFHTGNLVRASLSIVFNERVQLFASIIPIIGGFIGVVIASILRNKITIDKLFAKTIILIEMISFFLIGLIWPSSLDSTVNFILSALAMFQLSSFRKSQNFVHNTTIMTGNLRTLAQLFTNMFFEKKRWAYLEFVRYLITFLSFPFGVIVGGIASVILGKIAIWICVIVLFLNSRQLNYS